MALNTLYTAITLLSAFSYVHICPSLNQCYMYLTISICIFYSDLQCVILYNINLYMVFLYSVLCCINVSKCRDHLQQVSTYQGSVLSNNVIAHSLELYSVFPSQILRLTGWPTCKRWKVWQMEPGTTPSLRETLGLLFILLVMPESLSPLYAIVMSY